MTIIHSEQYQHEGRNYEIRLYGSAWDFTVQAYLDSERANGYSYSVSLPTEIDLQLVKGLDAVRVLFEKAKEDIHDKAWERYVEAYVASLKKTATESLGCRKCGRREILASTVDSRQMFECSNCGNVWYEPRRMTSAPLTILDGITEGVAKNGSHEIDVAILLNFNFRPSDRGPSFEDQLENWSRQNKLKYEYFYSGKHQHLRFRR